MVRLPGSNNLSANACKGLLSLAFLFILAWFSYFLDRQSFFSLTGLFLALFSIYLMLLHPYWDRQKNHFHRMVFLAVIARLIILFAVPNLSDDYFRFLWDGRLFMHGINPFDFTPAEFMASAPDGNAWSELYTGVNSKGYYSIYPPVNQFVFYLANLFSPNSIHGGVAVMKLFFFAAELSTIFLLIRLAGELSINRKVALFYALNPLVIIEFCGNIHFEALMISFLLLSIYLLIRQRNMLSAIAFAFAILTKIHPLMLLPFIIKFLGWKKGIRFTAIAGIISVAGFGLLFYPAGNASLRIENFMTSFRLYFETFEFNASIYYIFRWIGFESYGYNPIDKVGKLMFVFQVLVLARLLLGMQRNINSLIGIFFFAYLAYYLFATTVHPWYILPMLPLALMVNYRSVLVWTAVIVLSYFAYSQPDWHENFGLLTLEYTCIFAFLLYELSDREKLASIIR